jgi:hypothetical protein
LYKQLTTAKKIGYAPKINFSRSVFSSAALGNCFLFELYFLLARHFFFLAVKMAEEE